MVSCTFREGEPLSWPGVTAGQLINKLNPMIEGWANYHRHVASKKTFVRVETLAHFW